MPCVFMVKEKQPCTVPPKGGFFLGKQKKQIRIATRLCPV